MPDKQQESDKLKYDRTLMQGERGNNVRKFENIDEAAGFWKGLWEGDGSGNAGTE